MKCKQTVLSHLLIVYSTFPQKTKSAVYFTPSLSNWMLGNMVGTGENGLQWNLLQQGTGLEWNPLMGTSWEEERGNETPEGPRKEKRQGRNKGKKMSVDRFDSTERDWNVLPHVPLLELPYLVLNQIVVLHSHSLLPVHPMSLVSYFQYLIRISFLQVHFLSTPTSWAGMS